MVEALYRKYRPQIFEDVVGQEHIERTIKNAIGRDTVSHAYLFTGPRGTGKTTTARLLAKALLCESGPTPEPDGSCENCEAIAQGIHPDVYELDAASRTGVENVREEIIGRVHYAPTQGRYKVYIIDEVHMLSTAAFNALLKTLEEPPDHVVFILCTTDPQKVPETIHSRCQRFDFRRISVEAIVSRLGAICLAEDVEFEGEALDLIAYRAEGGMRNALTSLEQIITFSEGKVTLKTAERLLGSLDSSDMAEIVLAIGKRDVASCFTWTATYVETGSDLAQFARDLSEHIRNMYILSLSENDMVLEVSETTRKELVQELEYFGSDRLARMLGILGDLTAELKTSTNPRLSFEIALTRMVRPDSDITLESLAERIEALEAGRPASAPVVPRQPTVAVESSEKKASDEPAAKQPPSFVEPEPKTEPELVQKNPSEELNEEASVEVGPSSIEPEPSQKLDDVRESASESTEPGTSTFDRLANPAALQRVWHAVLQAIKKEKAAYGVLFLNTKLSFDDVKKTLAISFPSENVFAFSAAQKPEVYEAVSRAFDQELGSKVEFSFVQGEGGASAVMAAQAEVAQSAPPAMPEPALQTAQEVTPSPVQQPPAFVASSSASDLLDEPFKPAPFVPDPLEEVVKPSKPEGNNEEAVPAVQATEIQEEASKSEDFAENDLKKLLAQDYGEGVIFEPLDEE